MLYDCIAIFGWILLAADAVELRCGSLRWSNRAAGVEHLQRLHDVDPAAARAGHPQPRAAHRLGA